MSTEVSWSGWVSVLVAACVATATGAWILARRILVSVTRDEFVAELDKRHAENRQGLVENRQIMVSLTDELTRVGKDVAYLRGRYERP